MLETFLPQRTLADVVIPPQTRRALEQALAKVRNHRLTFHSWGLGERHTSGRGLTFNFAGPPGTGKTICAEAVAHALGMKLLIVDYAEAESMWVGETPKNIARIFRAAADQDAVLLFDEADAIATRRSTGVRVPYDREMNLTVNVLLRELEAFNGIVIFATNLAANFDPAFERRIRIHVLFEMPGVEEREQIWRLQIHPTKTPLASDVGFHRRPRCRVRSYRRRAACRSSIANRRHCRPRTCQRRILGVLVARGSNLPSLISCFGRSRPDVVRTYGSGMTLPSPARSKRSLNRSINIANPSSLVQCPGATRSILSTS